MSILTVLHEASALLMAAEKHAPVLLEGGVTEDDLHHLRVLIAKVAAYSYIYNDGQTNITKELGELQRLKEVILRTAELKFGDNSTLLKEFCTIS
jgi:hypothetical protein